MSKLPRLISTDTLAKLGSSWQKQIRPYVVTPRRRIAPSSQVAVEGRKAADMIVKWLVANGHGGDDNYSVGVLDNDDLVISKVNGVTSSTVAKLPSKGGNITLEEYITDNDLEEGRDIWVAQKFNTSVGSNHAEACIMAAPGPGRVEYINCTGPHCAFCFEMMDQDGVAAGSARGNANQQGWAHPFGPVFFGSQVNVDVNGQLEELEKLSVVPTQEEKSIVKLGTWLLSKPSQGKWKKWL